MQSKLFAVLATVGLVLSALGPGVATVAADTTTDSLEVEVDQAEDGSATVTVTDNETAAENASVSVEALENGSYNGTGDYSTDENGTVELPAPETGLTVRVNATVDNVTVSTTEDLEVDNETEEEDSFGVSVSAFVEGLLSDDATDIGQQVAEFATQNNPGNAPDHAGPPEDAGPDSNETGPPADAGPDGDDNETETNETVEDEEETEEEETEDGTPPANANAGGN